MEFHSEQSVEELLGASLSALSNANSMMQSQQVCFLLQNCFTFKAGKHIPVTVELYLESGSLHQGSETKITMTSVPFRVPLISLLPLNSLAVDSAKLNFALSVTSLGVTATETRDSFSSTNRPKVVLRGMLSSMKDISGTGKHETKTDKELKISLSVKSLPLPKGTRTLLDLYTRGIYPVSETEKMKL